ncbi:MAG: glycosyl hydrolase family 28-related protein, partial [Flavobacteriales bacterium]|nr:glycosyl hydrolase family 28-related protein [Flavobacteriales bacterium]
MVRIIFFSHLFILHFSLSFFSRAQNLSPERITAWNLAGLTMDIQAPENQVDITDYGADNTGVNSCNSAYTAAIASLEGTAGTIYFPAGEYFFTATISVPDSVFLKGESTSTQLNFDQGGTGNLIQLAGSVISTEVALAADGIKGTYQIELADASALIVGDIIRLGMFDEDLMFSTWAYGSMGQIIEVAGIDDNILTLADTLNHHYPLSRNPFARKLNAIRAAGIECLTINRLDNSEAQESNIYIHAGYNCVVRNVGSNRCDFGHVE